MFQREKDKQTSILVDERHNSQVWNYLGFKLMVAIIVSPHWTHTQISSLPYKEIQSI